MIVSHSFLQSSHIATMLPSRGLVRSIPSAGVQRQISTHHVSARFAGNGRQLSTLRRTVGNGLTSSTAMGAASRYPTGPIALGGIASTRAFSLWGYGKKSAPADTGISTATATPPTENVVPDQTVEEAAASTSSASTQSLSEATPAALDGSSTGAADLSSISDIVNNVTAEDILSRAHEIGYLKSLGLDYGYGVTSTMQWALEHVHVWTGLGWGGAIIATSLLLRVVMTYPQIKSLRFSMNMKAMQEDPRHKQVMDDMRKAMLNSDPAARQQAQVLNNVLRQEYNAPLSSLLWTFLPIPFSIGFFRLLRGMTAIPVPGLENGGLLWFPDLTVADPYMGLSVIIAATVGATFKVNMRTVSESQKKMMNNLVWVMVPLMLVCTSWLSAGLNLMGAALAGATLVQQYILQIPSVRSALGIRQPPPSKPTLAPTPTPVSSQDAVYEAPRQSTSVREKLSSNLNEMRQGISESLEKFTGQARGSATEEAEKRRKQMIKKLEDTRAQQERDHFEKKYKGKK